MADPSAERTAGALGSGASSTADGLGDLCRLVLNLRLVALLISLLTLPQESGGALPLFMALVAGGVASYVPLRWWRRLAPTLMRHPAYLAGDLVVAMTLLAVVGSDNPFFYYTLGTAALAGLLYRWPGAAVFSALLLTSYWVGLELRPGDVRTFDAVVGNPALYPLVAAAGAGARRILDRQAETERELLAASQRAAAEAERSRLAREMHDSLAKTVQGMALAAWSLKTWIARDPDRARAEAEQLASAATEATAEARELVTDLRRDALDEPLATAITAYLDGWAERTGISAKAQLEDADAATPAARWELFAVAREVLANVEEHAGARLVSVALAERDGDLVLSVADDGCGFDPSGGTPDDGRGHFGLLGISERAEKVGASVELDTAPGHGTTVTVRVAGRRVRAGAVAAEELQ